VNLYTTVLRSACTVLTHRVSQSKFVTCTLKRNVTLRGIEMTNLTYIVACDKGNHIFRRADHRKPENGSNELHFETHLSICFT